MTTITYNDLTFELLEKESVLDCLLRNGQSVAHACRSGVCQACTMQANAGTPPAVSQRGLKSTLTAQNYFLACQCIPEEDLNVGEAGVEVDAVIAAKEKVNHRVARLWIQPSQPFVYFAGQYIHLIRKDGLVRPYSVASVPGQDPLLELHVLRVQEGRMSQWLCDEVDTGEPVRIRGAHGSCFYVEGQPDQPLLLSGTGTGLAPLYGIARDALHRGHSGPIHLYHGALRREDLYLVESLRELSQRYENFVYTPCMLQGEAEPGFVVGDLTSETLKAAKTLKGWRVFLCGHPDLVIALRKKVFLQGASSGEIFADAFYKSN